VGANGALENGVANKDGYFRAVILARKLAADQISTRGALPCLGMFSLPEFRNELADFDIQWSIDEHS